MVPIPRDVALVVVDQNDKFSDDQYDQCCDTEEVDKDAEVDE
jgi:hypothetical protein